DSKSPRTADKINEPLLAFAADFVMQQLVTSPKGGHGRDAWAAYRVRNEEIVKRAIVFYSDVSIDAHNSLYFRRGDPRHDRDTDPSDQL
ncbi:Hypothetical protein, putative, partial [Bodo saltans]